MTLNKNDTKYNHAAEKMQNALLSILNTKDFEMISVKEICEVAEVNRSTFYQHYDNINDLLNEAMESVYKTFFNQYAEIKDKNINASSQTEEDLFFIREEYLLPYLSFMKEHRKLFRILYEKNEVVGSEKLYSAWFKEVFAPILSRFGVPEEEHSLIMTFYLKGLLGMITEWIQNDCEMPVEKLISAIKKCIFRP